MKNTLIHLILLLLVSTSLSADGSDSNSFGDWFYNYWINGASLTLGVGVRETGFTIKRVNDGASGKLVHRNEEAYFLSYNTRPSYFKNSNFGYNWALNYSNFKMHQQETGKDQYQDLGTRLSGTFAYIVPTFFYNWGDKLQGSFVRAGIGLGLGLAKFDGNIILTTSTIPNDRVVLSHRRTDLQFAASLLLEARVDNWGLRISVAGPNLEENGYEINVSDAVVNLGYSYFF